MKNSFTLVLCVLYLGCGDGAVDPIADSENTSALDGAAGEEILSTDSGEEGGGEDSPLDAFETGSDGSDSEEWTDPEEDTIEPEEDTTEPEEDTTEPEEDTTEPEEDTTEPEEDTTEPEEDTTEPEEDTTEPEELPEVPPVSAECTLEGDYTINNANDLANLAGICAITGTLHFESDDNVDLILPDLVEIGGSLDAMNTGNWLSETGIQVMDLPVLTSIGGTLNLISVEYLTTLDLPNLKTVGEDIELRNSHEVTTVTLTSLEQVGGKLLLGEAPEVTSIALPALKEVGGLLHFYEVGYSEEEPLSDKVMTYDFPLLETVGAIRLITRRVDTLAFPSLKEVKWEIDIIGLMKHLSFDSLETVGAKWEEAPVYSGYNSGALMVDGYAFYDWDDNPPGTFGEEPVKYDSELETVTLPVLVHVEATVAAHPSKSLEAPLLETVGGKLLHHETSGFLSEWAPDDPAEPLVLFPSLVSAGSIDINTDHTLSFPILKSIEGTLYYDSPMEFPALESARTVWMDGPPDGWEEISFPSLLYTEWLFVRDADDLVTLSCPQLIGVPPGSDENFRLDIAKSPKLENLELPNLDPEVLTVEIDGSLIQHLSFPEVTVGFLIELRKMTELESFSAPKMESTGLLEITGPNALTTLDLPLLQSVVSDIKILGTQLNALHFPALESAKSLELELSVAETVNFPALMAVEKEVELDKSPLLKELLMPALESVGTSGIRIEACEVLSTLALDSLTEVSGDVVIGDLPNLAMVSLPSLTTMKGFFLEDTPATSLSMPNLMTVETSIQLEYNSELEEVQAPMLISVGTYLSVDTNPKLTTLNLSGLTSVGDMFLIAESPWLPQCMVDPLVTQLTESEGGAPAVMDVSGLRQACTCAEETGPVCFAEYVVENLTGNDIVFEALGLDGLPAPLNVLFIGDFLEFSILDVQGMGELRPSAFLSSFQVYGPTVAEGNLLYSGLTNEDWELQETGDLSKETYKLVMTQ